MPRRIEVELTSARDDGTWTWRAAGARQPKGVVAGDVVYPGAKVGDVVTAEADFDVDGITITSITPPKRKAGRDDLLEVTGSGEEFKPVITNWTERKGGRDRDPYGERPPRGDRPGGGGGGRDGGGRGPRPTTDWRARATPPAAAGGERGGDRGDRGGRRGGPGGGRDRDRTRSGEGAGLGVGGPTSERRGGPRPEGGPRRDRPGRAPAGAGEGRGDRGPAGEAKPRPKRLSPANTHRTAVLEALAPEQRPIAEQVLRGGIPAVRRAIEEQNATAKAAGQPEIPSGPLVALAEELLPRLKTAEWRDRAEAALADVDEIGLRDLRSVVSGGEAAARDEDTRTLAAQLREALERRLKQQHDTWVGEIGSALEEGRLVRALRVAARPPDPSMRFPAELASRLASAASEAMAADTPPDRWGALLEAVAASPVRTTVKPAAVPADAPESLLQAARQQAGRIPALTQLLGISMPPPPGPVRRIPPKPQQAPPPPPRAATPPPAPPTPVSDEPQREAPTPPEATDPVPPAAPEAESAGESSADVSSPVDAEAPGGGES